MEGGEGCVPGVCGCRMNQTRASSVRLTSRRGGWLGPAMRGLVRPGLEAILLTGVALGCAQIGWRIFAPPSTDLDAAPPAPDTAQYVSALEPVSPFSSAATSTTPLPAQLAGLRLTGVRVAETQAASGAILTFPDGAQHAFRLGSDIVDGVRLSQIAADHIVVQAAGADHQIPLEQRADITNGSLALALMGLGPAPAPSAAVETALVAPAPAAPYPVASSLTAPAAVPVDPAAQAIQAEWLMQTLNAVESRDGVPYAWRVASAPPAMLSKAGLQVGDRILSVNGVGPRDGDPLAAAASASRIVLAVERAGGEHIQLSIKNGAAS